MNPVKFNQILSYREMCNIEGQQQLQRGMNFNIGNGYSVILMSVKPNSPYADKVSEDGLTIYYEGHDSPGDKDKLLDQPDQFPGGSLTQNGLFSNAVDGTRGFDSKPLVRVYEKLYSGIWNYRGLFELMDYSLIDRGGRKVFEFLLRITSEEVDSETGKSHNLEFVDIEQTRQIPGKVKLEVYKRDGGVCRQCGAKDNLHFDHIFPYSKGGTSLLTDNIQLLCARHNLQKSAKII